MGGQEQLSQADSGRDWQMGIRRVLQKPRKRASRSLSKLPTRPWSPMNEKTMSPEELAKQITGEEWARKVCPAVLGIDRSMNGELLETWKLSLKCALYVDENGSLKLDDREYAE